METTAKLISEYGILVIIASIFLVQYVLESKNRYKRDEKYAESMTLLSKAIDNMANLIDLLRQANDNSAALFTKHDERSIRINENVNEVKSIVGNCKKK